MNHFLLNFFRSIVALGLGLPVCYGQYDATPLRAALAPEPHFQTNLSRKDHRFEGAEINKYRLYDFYARQAEYHLEQDEMIELLLPYPGLEGGRRGHWGATNEKLTSTVLDRVKEPSYDRLINRGPNGDQHVTLAHGDSQSLLLFEKSSPGLSKVILNARIHTPEFAFSYKVDRFGFNLAFQGQEYLHGHDSEWQATDGTPVDVKNDGYHLHGDQVIFRRLVGDIPLLDYPTMDYQAETAVFTRHLEWRGDAAALRFLLPTAATEIANPEISIKKHGNFSLAVVSNGKDRLIHRVSSTPNDSGLSLVNENGKIWLVFPKARKGTMIQISSWVATGNGTFPAVAPKTIELSKLLTGGVRYFTEDITVAGNLNADPVASGSAYEIDEIPVPSDNPYGVPMTTSGLTFAEDGSAYLCTLVGDVWKVTGIDDKLSAVKWQRFASGVNSPLGVEIVENTLYVTTQHGVLQLEDLNGDGEADLVRPFTNYSFPGSQMHNLHNLDRDAEGNFYLCSISGIYRISPDGAHVARIGGPARNPLGLGVRPDGLALSDQSEGNNSNGTCSIYESEHPENRNTVAKQRRILYLPRGIDNSPGSRIFMKSDRFGPLGNSLIGLSYGTGRIYQIMRDTNHGSPQAALSLLPGEFSSGTCRLANNPKDGQLYVVGLDGWGDFATTEGSFSRLRFTGKRQILPISWKSYNNGISVRFTEAIDPESLDPKQFFLQQWNYIDSAHTYGSGEYSVKYPDQLGHDRIRVGGVNLAADRKEIFIHAPTILPAMCTQIFAKLKAAGGEDFRLDLYATINQLPMEAMPGTPAVTEKQHDLVVPYKDSNGETYETLTRFFDQRAGLKVEDRPVGPSVSYVKSDLNYKWIAENVLEANLCIACHGAGMQFDFSTYDLLMKAVNTNNPKKSHLYGMIDSGSMPPMPLPRVAPDMTIALLEWIEMGAPQ